MKDQEEIRIGDRIAVCGVSPKGRWFALPEGKVTEIRDFVKGEQAMYEGKASTCPETGTYLRIKGPDGRGGFMPIRWIRKLDKDDITYREMHLDEVPEKPRFRGRHTPR